MSTGQIRANATVLVVEDEPSIADVLAITLRFHGFEVVTAGGVHAALAAARSVRPDAVLLDITLPDGDGRQVCRILRAERPELAVVFLTARDAPADVVLGLTLGGDDYITKPFNVDELVARTRAVLRRTRPSAAVDSAPAAPRPPVLRHGGLELDEATYTARRGGRSADLTPTEFALLRYLVRHADRIVPKEQLLRHVWRYEHSVESTVVETYISYLRRKLDPLAPDEPPLITTRRGVGYGLRSAGPSGSAVPDDPAGSVASDGPTGFAVSDNPTGSAVVADPTGSAVSSDPTA